MTDPYVAAIDAALKTRQIKRVELGRLLGLDSAQVARIFKGQRKLQLHEAQKIDEWLGIPPTAGNSTQAVSATVVPMPGMIPLFGWVGSAAKTQLSLGDQSIRGYTPMHPAQAHMRDAFALEVSDVRMMPRYEPGEIVYVAPRRWPMRGQDCFVVTVDGNGLIRRFVSRSGDKINLAQLNPERDLQMDLSEVQDVHAIVGRN